MSKNLVVGVGAFALILGACGGAEPDRSRTIEPKTETVKSDDQELAPKNIEDALLTINDMPNGWSAQKVPDFGSAVNEDDCGNPLPSQNRPVDGALADFTADPTNGPRVSQSVFRYEPGEVAERFNVLLERANECQIYEKKGSKVKVQALSYEKVGDESIATRYVVKTRIGFTVVSDKVRWRRGDLSAVVSTRLPMLQTSSSLRSG